MIKHIRNIIFAIAAASALMSCAQPKPQTYTIACDATGSPVLVTAS